MNILTQIIAITLGGLLIGGMTLLSMRSRGSRGNGDGPHTFRVHPVWFVFGALGGLFFVGLCGFIVATAAPGERSGPAWFGVVATGFFVFYTYVLRSISVTVDGDQLTVVTLGKRREAALRDIESFKTVGMMIEIRLKPGPDGKVPPPMVCLAALRGLGDLAARVQRGTGGR